LACLNKRWCTTNITWKFSARQSGSANSFLQVRWFPSVCVSFQRHSRLIH